MIKLNCQLKLKDNNVGIRTEIVLFTIEIDEKYWNKKTEKKPQNTIKSVKLQENV